jgi:class 3 adenylate cyclase
MTALLLYSVPHTLLAVVATGMAVAFLAADRHSATSQALAITLMSLGVGIFLNVALTESGTVVPRFAALLPITDGLAIVFYLEWLLRVRRTLPAGRFDTRGGDMALRLGQAAGVFYTVMGMVAPTLRIESFLGSGRHGWQSVATSGFWLFALPVLFSSLMGMLATALLMRRRPDPSERIRILGFILAAPLFIASFVLPVQLGAIAVVSGLMIVLVGAVQYHVLQGQRGQFLSRFLSPQVAEVVNRRGLKGAMEQAHIEISVVCCDLRGFTAYSQAHPSSRTIEVLRDYYGVVGKVVAEFGATIKDYAGDGILILIGAPLPEPEHAAKAIAVAERVREAGVQLGKRWSTRRGRLGIGVGVASGFVTVGVIGSDSRLEYTAVGPAVNLASRLCEEAAHKEILIAPRTAELAGREDLRPKRNLELKGFREVDEVFQLKAA